MKCFSCHLKILSIFGPRLAYRFSEVPFGKGGNLCISRDRPPSPQMVPPNSECTKRNREPNHLFHFILFTNVVTDDSL